MTRRSRGVSAIQHKATGNDMKKKMLKNKQKSSTKLDLMSLGDAKSAGPVPGMKCGGMAKGYAKGGRIDGCAVKGKTRGKMV